MAEFAFYSTFLKRPLTGFEIRHDKMWLAFLNSLWLPDGGQLWTNTSEGLGWSPPQENSLESGRAAVVSQTFASNNTHGPHAP